MSADRAAVSGAPRALRARVVERVELSARYFLLRLARPDDMPDPLPGQFIHVDPPGADRFFLRRPFSIHDCDGETFELLVVEAGVGSRRLRTLSSGDPLAFYGPLGGGTFPPPDGRRVLAVGGGVGLAPLFFYGARVAGGFRGAYRLVYGARTREDLFLDAIDLAGRGVELATDDGSFGRPGSAVDAARELLERDGADVLFSCGPTPMMRAVEALAREAGVAHLASLENRMACALGACRACVVPTRRDGADRYATVCHDGPVFDGRVLDWDALPRP